MLSMNSHQRSRPNSRFIKTCVYPAAEIKKRVGAKSTKSPNRLRNCPVSTFPTLVWGRMSSFISANVIQIPVLLLSSTSDPLASLWLLPDTSDIGLLSFRSFLGRERHFRRERHTAGMGERAHICSNSVLCLWAPELKQAVPVLLFLVCLPFQWHTEVISGTSASPMGKSMCQQAKLSMYAVTREPTLFHKVGRIVKYDAGGARCVHCGEEAQVNYLAFAEKNKTESFTSLSMSCSVGDLLLKRFSFFFPPSLLGLQVSREEGGGCNLTEGLHQIWPRLRRCLLKPGLTAGWTGNRPYLGLLLLLRADAPVLQLQSGNTHSSFAEWKHSHFTHMQQAHKPGAIWRDLLGCCFRDDLFSMEDNSVSMSNYTHVVWF